MSSKFDTFYKAHVVLHQADQDELRRKKNLNLQRLKDGLAEYNEENGTSYRVADRCVQGSVAMSTVVQNEDNDYDIDVEVVFDKEAIGDIGAQAMRKCAIGGPVYTMLLQLSTFQDLTGLMTGAISRPRRAFA